MTLPTTTAIAAQLRRGFVLACLSALVACSGSPWTSNEPEPRSDGSIPSQIEDTFKADGVLLIVVDTLRADALGCGGYYADASPKIDRLAQRGILFERFYSASPWTLPSFGSILTGFSPSIHKAGKTRKRNTGEGLTSLNRKLLTIPEMLPEHRSYGLVNNTHLNPKFGMADGYEEYIHNRAGYSGYVNARKTADRAWDMLSSQVDGKFFMLLHFFDPHVPYRPPKAFERKHAAGDKGTIDNLSYQSFSALHKYKYIPTGPEIAYLRGLYDGEVTYVDHQIGKLVAKISKSELLKNTWVIITSDHGEEFYEHGYFEHGHTYTNEVTQVPFILVPPKGHPLGKGQRVSTTSRHIDIAPTILDLLDATAPYPIEGKSVASLISGEETKDRECFMEYNLRVSQKRALFDGKRKVIVPKKKPSRAWMFDLHTDPMEQQRLSKKKTLRKMKRRLTDYSAAIRAMTPAHDVEAKSVELSEEEAEALRSLGYIE